MFLALIRYAFFAPLSVLLSIIAIPMAPFLALYSLKTGPVLPGRWNLWNTQDVDMDGGWVNGSSSYPLEWKSTKLGLWKGRTLWLLRNRAYGFAEKMGYDQTGSVIYDLTGRDRDAWDTGVTNWRWMVRRKPTQDGDWSDYAFEFRGQFFFLGTRYVRVFIGYKLDYADEGKRLIVFHVNPFRSL